MQLGQGLAFLHNDAKLLHHNLCPENVVINEQGAWKIFGFDFCSQSINPVDPNVRIKNKIIFLTFRGVLVYLLLTQRLKSIYIILFSL